MQGRRGSREQAGCTAAAGSRDRNRESIRRWRRTNCTCIHSGTGRRLEAGRRAGQCRRSSGARRFHRSCRGACRTPSRHPCRRCHLPIRRVPRCLRIRRGRPRLRCQRCRPIQRRPLRHQAEDTQRRGSRRNNKRRCRARNRDTRPGSPRSRSCRHHRSVRPRIPRYLRVRRHRSCRPRSIHHRRRLRVWPSIHTLQPRARGEERSTASFAGTRQHHACHGGPDAGSSRGRPVCSR